MTDHNETAEDSARDDIASAIQDSSDALEVLMKLGSGFDSRTLQELEEAASNLQRAQEGLNEDGGDLLDIISEVRSVNGTLSNIADSADLSSGKHQTIETQIQQSTDALDQAEQALDGSNVSS